MATSDGTFNPIHKDNGKIYYVELGRRKFNLKDFILQKGMEMKIVLN